MPGQPKWLALGYSVPAAPSRKRVYVWRKLREIGAEAFKPGVAVLPNSGESLGRFRTLRDKVRELGGEAWLLEMNFTEAKDDLEMERRFEEAAGRERRALIEECRALVGKLESLPPDQKKSQLAAGVQKALSRYERSAAKKAKNLVASELEAGMNELFGTLRSMPGELSAILKKELEAKKD